MFFDKWIPSKFLVKQEVCSLEIVFTERRRSIYITSLKQKGTKVDVNLSQSLDELKLPAQITKNKIPVILVLNGDGIVTKKIQSTSGDPDQQISESLPTVQKNEFYIQLFTNPIGNNFISFCRKTLVKGVMDELAKGGIDPVSVYVGPSIIMGMEPIWSNFNKVPTTLLDAELINGGLADFTSPSVENSISVSGTRIDRVNTLGFAAGLNYFLSEKIAFNSDKELGVLLDKHIDSNKFKFLMLVCVGIALATALVNVFFFTVYFDRNNKIEAQLGVYEGKNARINTLLEDYQKKKGLIEGAGVLDINHLSEYADRIAQTVPSEVVLTNLYFNPKTEKDNTSDSLVTFRNKELIIQGNCNKSLVINEWINILKLQKFIKAVNLEKFSFSKENFLPNFEIEIKM